MNSGAPEETAVADCHSYGAFVKMNEVPIVEEI